MTSNKRKSRNLRYKVHIEFKPAISMGVVILTEPLIEDMKTLKEAMLYKSMVDDTVVSAYILDKVKKKIHRWI